MLQGAHGEMSHTGDSAVPFSLVFTRGEAEGPEVGPYPHASVPEGARELDLVWFQVLAPWKEASSPLLSPDLPSPKCRGNLATCASTLQ